MKRVIPNILTATENKFQVLGTLPNISSIESPVNFLIKETCSAIVTLEKEWEELDTAVMINHLTPKWGWIPKENIKKKTKKFYQMIIIDIASIEIYPEVDKKDPSKPSTRN